MNDFVDIDVLGVRIRVEYADDLDSSQRRTASDAWSGARSEGVGEADLSRTFSAGADFERAMERLTVDVTLSALDALRGRALMFHAAGVADESGRVAAFVGPSGRGKTTLSRELGRHCGYVSDETIAVDAELNVFPYRKPLSVVRAAKPKQQVSPDEAGLRGLPQAPLRLASLVLIERDAALSAPEIAPLPLVDALPELVPQMSYLRDQERPLRAIAVLCDAIGGVRRLRYPEAATVPPLLPELFATPPTVHEWQPAPTPAESGPYDASGVDDAILTDGHVIVMAHSMLHVLDGIAPVVWTEAAAGRDLDGIVDVVVEQHGAPPQGSAHELVAAAVDELIDAGVLSRR
ncbi:ATP-binding protein [Microbacterium sp.]|uniref:ATP-binding protein n=1 Tax=Microbacterium sp. TaxID=51671 RepID=UPI002810E912|nr:ATP-binding protein [Microbacterium sp.]